MKKDIHPTYYPETKIKCSCGVISTVGSTLPQMEVEICSQCHPFYTGTTRIIDAAGRVEKFQARLKKTEAIKKRKA